MSFFAIFQPLTGTNSSIKNIKTLKYSSPFECIKMTTSDDINAAYVIKDLETLRVVSDPLRAQILETLILQTLTVKQVAEKLGVGAMKLYYHIRLLEKHGLIEVVNTRVISGIVEKYFHATAQRLTVDPSLLASDSDAGKENINTVLLSTIDTTRDDILRSLQARYFELEDDSPIILISRQLSHIPDKRADEFCQRLEALLKEFGDADNKSTDMQTYALTIAFYPSFHFHEPSSGNDGKEQKK